MYDHSLQLSVLPSKLLFAGLVLVLPSFLAHRSNVVTVVFYYIILYDIILYYITLYYIIVSITLTSHWLLLWRITARCHGTALLSLVLSLHRLPTYTHLVLWNELSPTQMATDHLKLDNCSIIFQCLVPTCTVGYMCMVTV